MIVTRHEIRNLPKRGQVNLMYFHRGQVLLVSAERIGLYRDEAALDNPFGNGVLGYEAIPVSLRPVWHDELGYVREQRAGYVCLTSGAVLFIRPDGIALYDNASGALHNRGLHWLMPFSAA